MRIAYLALIELDVPNACLIHTREIAEQMGELGNEVELFLPKPLAMQRWDHVRHHWVRFWGFDSLRHLCFLLEACIRLALAHRNRPFDLLYLRELEPPGPLLWFCRRLNLPLFVEVNGWHLDDLHLLGADADRLTEAEANQRELFGAARGIVASTEGNATSVVRYYGQPAEKVLVQELGVNPVLFGGMEPADARRELGLPEDAPLLLFAGSFHPHHDLHTLIRAFARAHERIPNATLLLVGDGAQRISAEAWVREEGVADAVRFIGVRAYEEMPLWFAAADMLVSPLLARKIAQQDGACATKLWEAMSAGTPVVVTDLPGTSSYALFSENAWVAPPEDVGLLADAMVAALQEGEARQARIERARRYVLENRTWRQAAADTLSFIERRLKGGG